MNDVGKPCAGEPHARFERGPLAEEADTVIAGTRTERETHRTERRHRHQPPEPAAYLASRARARTCQRSGRTVRPATGRRGRVSTSRAIPTRVRVIAPKSSPAR